MMPITECSGVSMALSTIRFCAPQLAGFVLIALTWTLAGAQANPSLQDRDRQKKAGQNPAPSPATHGAPYSGMCSFLLAGGFGQATVEDHGRVTAFDPCCGDSKRD